MRKFKTLSVILALLFLAVLAAYAMYGQRLEVRPQKALSLLPTNVDMHLSGVNYTEVKHGRKEWTLKADELRYFKDNERLTFSGVRMAFYPNGENEYTVDGRAAEYDRKTRIVRLSGAVRARDILGWRLNTMEMTYDVENMTVRIPGAFLLDGPSLTIQGRGLSLNLATKVLTVDENVNMVFKTI